MAALVAILVAALALVEVALAWSFRAALSGAAAVGAIALSALALASGSSETGLALVGGGFVIVSAGLLAVGHLVEAALTTHETEPRAGRGAMDTQDQDRQDDS